MPKRTRSRQRYGGLDGDDMTQPSSGMDTVTTSTPGFDGTLTPSTPASMGGRRRRRSRSGGRSRSRSKRGGKTRTRSRSRSRSGGRRRKTKKM